MKAMNTAQEFDQAAPKARYNAMIVKAEATVSKKSGSSMIEIAAEIAEGPHKGQQWFDYLITDGSAKGSGIARRKLRGLGVAEVDTDSDIPDTEICRRLLGLTIVADLDNEPKFGKNEATGEYDRPLTVWDARLNKEVPAMKLVARNYSLHNIGQAQAQAQAPLQGQGQGQYNPPQMQQPQFIQPQQGFQQQQVPQGYATPLGQPMQPVQQYTQPQQQVFQQAQQAQQAQQQFNPGLQPAYAQPQQVQGQGQGQGQGQQAAPPWQQPGNGAVNAPIAQQADNKPKRGRMKPTDVDPS